MDDRTWDLFVKINKDHTDTFIKLCNAEGRVKELERALHKINNRLNDKDSWLAQSIDCRNFAEDALGEKKDGN